MTKTQEIAAEIAKQDHVLRADALGNRIRVVFPRERGGYSYLTLPEAKKLLARLQGDPR